MISSLKTSYFTAAIIIFLSVSSFAESPAESSGNEFLRLFKTCHASSELQLMSGTGSYAIKCTGEAAKSVYDFLKKIAGKHEKISLNGQIRQVTFSESLEHEILTRHEPDKAAIAFINKSNLTCKKITFLAGRMDPDGKEYSADTDFYECALPLLIDNSYW